MATTTIDHSVTMPTEDGVRLQGDVLRPAGAGSYPTIVMRTPYDRTTYASVSLQVHALRLAEAGYAVVLQDVRGRFGSGGRFEPFVNEQRDGLATIEWITSQPWSNGIVAGGGVSYNAFCQQAVARAGHSAFGAWVPGLGPADVRTTWIRQGDAFNYGFHLSWALGGVVAEASTAWEDPVATARRGPLDQPELRQSAAGDFYFEWLRRRDPYPDTSAVPRTEDLADVASPALVLAGMYDVFHHGSVGLYGAISSRSGHHHSLVLGPWDHSGLPLGRRSGDADFGPSASLDLGTLQAEWYDVHLRGTGEAPPRVRVFVTGASEWLNLPGWPPPASDWTLEPDGSFGLVESADPTVVKLQLDPNDPTPTVGGRVFPWEPVMRPGAFDQSWAAHRDDVLVFTSDPLTEPTRVVGLAKLDVTVGGSEAGSDVHAVVCDVSPDGSAWNVADGVARLHSAHPDAVPASVDLGAVAHEFRPGHRVQVAIAAGSFPRFDAFHWRGHRLFQLGGGATRLVLPLVSA